jgi:hypothetical protein
MARTEVEDFSQTTLITTAAPEHFPALEPTEENQRIWRRDIEPFAIHFFAWNFKVRSQPGSDRVTRFDHPDAFALIRFPPDEIAGGAHQPLKDL